MGRILIQVMILALPFLILISLYLKKKSERKQTCNTSQSTQGTSFSLKIDNLSYLQVKADQKIKQNIRC